MRKARITASLGAFRKTLLAILLNNETNHRFKSYIVFFISICSYCLLAVSNSESGDEATQKED